MRLVGREFGLVRLVGTGWENSRNTSIDKIILENILLSREIILYSPLTMNPLCLSNSYFHQSEAAKNFLLQQGLLVETKCCPRCNVENSTKLVKQSPKTDPDENRVRWYYRCKKNGCQARQSIYYGTILQGTRLRFSLPQIFNGAMLWMARVKF